MLQELLLAAAAIAALAIGRDVLSILRSTILPLLSPIRAVPGPDAPTWFFGNMKEIIAGGPNEAQTKWHAQFGPIVRYKTMLSVRSLNPFESFY